MTTRSEQLSRIVSHALRHEPWLYELELDEHGWVPVDELLDAIHAMGSEWSGVEAQELLQMIAGSEKKRHEIVGERIRALYGHSVPGRLSKVESAPPVVLFHGTSPKAWQVIQTDGLKPMRRQFVHMSIDRETAVMVGQRKSPDPLILIIHAEAAVESGVRFFAGNESVWLAERVPPEFVVVDSGGPTEAV